MLKALDMVAPGTALREGVDNVIHASTGALIVIGEPDEISFLFCGGLKLDVDYTPQLLYQVAKMDGAIVLDPEGKRISWANVQLMPDPTIHSSETGTRHRTAERVSKQTKALVIAISARRDVVSLYHEGMKYILQDIPTVLSKANQGLATLEKYRRRLDPVAGRLTTLEFAGAVDPARRARRPAAGRAAAAHLLRGRALHHRARRRGPADRDAARGDRRRRAPRPRRADPRLRGRRLRGGPRRHPRRARPHAATQSFSTSAAWPSLLGHDRKVNPHDLRVSARGYRALGRIPRLAAAGRREGHPASSEASRRSSRRARPSSPGSTASGMPAPPTSGTVSTAFGRSRSSIDTHRYDGRSMSARPIQGGRRFPN